MCGQLAKITIVLATYNRAAILSRCLESILGQKYSNWEVFVIDDSSQDDTEKVVRGFLYDNRVHYVRNDRNLGMSCSREKGLQFCNTDLVFIGEDDVFLDEYCLGILVETFMGLMDEVNGIFHIAPKIVDVSGDRWAAGQSFETKASSSLQDSPYTQTKVNVLTGFLYHQKGEKFGETTFLPSFGLYNCGLLRKIGFSKDYVGKPILHEDDDLHIRVKKCGLRLFYQPKAVAYHLRHPRGGERSFNLLKQQFFTLRNHFHFIVKFFGLRSFYMAPIFTVSHVLYPIEVIMVKRLSGYFMKDLEKVII